MSNFTALFSGGSGVPVGAIVQGQFGSNPDYLPCDGNDYISASYPLLDKSQLGTFGTNQPVSVTTSAGFVAAIMASSGSIVVGFANTSTTNFITSTDGATWTLRTFPAAISAGSVKYAQGQFVLVGKTSSNMFCVYTSTDGINWTFRYNDAANSTGSDFFNGLINSGLSYGNGLWICVTLVYGPTSNVDKFYTSPDGITWTIRSFPTMTNPRFSVFHNGRFILASSTGAYTTVDGTSVTNLTNYPGSVSRLTSVGGMLFALVGSVVYWAESISGPWNITNVSSNPLLLKNGILIRDGGDYSPLNSFQLSNCAFVYNNGTVYGAVTIGNRVVFCGSATGTAWYIDFDTNKFKTPKYSGVTGTGVDTYYIKAK